MKNALALFILFPLIATATPLTLEDYLRQVQKSHEGVVSALLLREGAAKHAKDYELQVTPTAFGSVSLTRDDHTDPLFRTDEQTHNIYSLGVSELTPFGLNAKLSYTLDYDHYDFQPAAGYPSLSIHQAKPMLELTQSLWRNGFGSETQQKLEYQEANALASSFSQSYQARVILSQAESAYWSLSLARSSVRVTAEVLDRARKLYEWNDHRVHLGLADDSDLAQAEAQMKLRQLDYQQALDNERIASRALNDLRSVDEDAVPEEITPLGPELKAFAPARAKMREDVLAAQQQERAASANSKLSDEKDKPTLEVFASGALNGSDANADPAMADSFKSNQPTVTAGVRFSMPLDFGLMSDAHKGYALEEEGASRLYQRKYFEQENDWHDLTKKLSEARLRYELSQNLELAQKRKLEIERARLTRGKTTTFNVIQFEQDFAQAELGTLRAQNDILQILAQMKTFGGPL